VPSHVDPRPNVLDARQWPGDGAREVRAPIAAQRRRHQGDLHVPAVEGAFATKTLERPQDNARSHTVGPHQKRLARSRAEMRPQSGGQVSRAVSQAPVVIVIDEG
jgi:hypothetical protein